MRQNDMLNIGEVFAQAMKAYEDGRISLAKRLAREIVEARPDFGGAHYLMGLLATDQGHGRHAVDHLARAIAISPDQPALHIAMGRALELGGEIAEATLHYRTVLAIDPDHAEAHARLAALQAKAGKIRTAIDHARQAVAAHPGHAEAWNTLGALLHGVRRPIEAVEPLRRALQLRPDWPVALNNFGVVLRDLDRLDEAITILGGAVELQPGNAGYRANLASTLRRAGRLTEARAEAERATKAGPRHPEAWIELGLARQEEGYPEGAAAAFERAVAAAPDNLDALYALAEVRRALGETDRAAAAYRRCLDLDPEDRHGAALGLAHVGAAPAPGKAPEAFVRQLFDDYAETFDTALLGKLDYRAPDLLDTALARILPGARDLAILDAGCGTGLAAPMLRPRARRLDGVDLSPAMVAKAAARGLYDEVVVDDLIRALETRPTAYDLIVAADVLVYLGDLVPVLAAAKAALAGGGTLAFTTERAEDGVVLGPKNRYAHAPDYIRAAAADAGFSVALLEDAVSRREAGQDVPGLVAVLKA